MIFTRLFGLLGLMYSPSLLFADTECPVVSTISDRRSDKTTFRLVQYNVEWLFIDYYSSANCPGSGCTWKTAEDAETHLSYVSNVLNNLQPDLVNFCEVEGCDELNMVINEMELNGSTSNAFKPYLKKGTDTSTGQNVGMITKVDPLVSLYRTETKVSYPIPGSQCGYTGSPSSSGVSKHYITEFAFGNLKTAFIAAHLIAYPTDPARCAQREAQAQVLQYVVYNYILEGYEIILLGDMNDFDAEILDINSDKPISKVLDILKGLDGEYKGKYSLTNIANRIAQNERFSDWWDSDNNCATSSQKDYSMIDHILMTSKINSKIINAYIYHEYKEYCGKWNSDHYPVVVDFAF
jgi:exonuclease III